MHHSDLELLPAVLTPDAGGLATGPEVCLGAALAPAAAVAGLLLGVLLPLPGAEDCAAVGFPLPDAAEVG